MGDYIELNKDQPSDEIFAWLTQNSRVETGLYNKIKMVIDPVVQLYFKVTVESIIVPGGTYYTKAFSFDQAIGVDINDYNDFLTTDPSQAGWWRITLISGYDTMIKDFLDSSNNITSLVISEGEKSRARVEIRSDYDVIEVTPDYYTADVNPSDVTSVYVD